MLTALKETLTTNFQKSGNRNETFSMKRHNILKANKSKGVVMDKHKYTE